MVQYADRVKETTFTAGTGDLDLEGAVDGFQTFVEGTEDGAVVPYFIKHNTTNEWECGIGTVTNATVDTLSRDTVTASSTGSKLDLTSGEKTVVLDVIADKVADIELMGYLGMFQ